MIDLPKTIELPKQTDSPSVHLRGYGCKVHADTAMVQLFLQHSLSVDELLAITNKGIERLYIWDNDIPINKEDRLAWEKKHGKPCPEWYRCYVKDPVSLIALTGEYFVRKISGKEISRGVPSNRDIPLKYDFMEIEWATYLGSHFGLGDWVNGKIETLYNPWSSLKVNGIRTVRYWRIFETT